MNKKKPSLKKIINYIIRRGPKTSPRRRICFLIIHGVGNQEPYETLDAFVRNFLKAYSNIIKEHFHELTLIKSHKLVNLPNGISSKVTIESDHNKLPVIDIYEYYWAYMTEDCLDVKEVIEWIFDVASGARDFYKNPGNINIKNINRNVFTSDGEFHYLMYLSNMLSYIEKFSKLVSLIVKCLKIIYPVNQFPKAVTKLFNMFFKKYIMDSLRDIAVYTTMDRKSKYYKSRKLILNNATDFVKSLLEIKSGGNEKYDELVIFGHSLGSVIGYDVLDRLNRMMNVDRNLQKYSEKIKGLITFGSPLDKVAFLFQERINKKKQNIRYSIVTQLHNFKRKHVDDQSLENGILQFFENTKWINFWTETDPISGNLNAYSDVENIHLDLSNNRKKIDIKCHSLYWESYEMHRQIIEKMIFNNL